MLRARRQRPRGTPRGRAGVVVFGPGRTAGQGALQKRAQDKRACRRGVARVSVICMGEAIELRSRLRQAFNSVVAPPTTPTWSYLSGANV
jgi:hypothetical protein